MSYRGTTCVSGRQCVIEKLLVCLRDSVSYRETTCVSGFIAKRRCELLGDCLRYVTSVLVCLISEIFH